jgi:hypothetical protein
MPLKDIRPALRSCLLADAAIAAVVGSRVHSVRLPSGVPAGPSIVYNLITESTDRHMTGPSGLVISRFQIDAWATSADAANNLGLLIKERLDGFRGTVESVVIQGIFSEDARNDYDSAANAHRAQRDYFVTYGAT